jgi:predicted peptidase
MMEHHQGGLASAVKNSRNHYYTGETTVFASQYDQRFSYCLYVPSTYEIRTRPLPVIVVQHGTERRFQEYRDNFAAFAEANQCVVLTPLFPAGIEDSEDLHNYKFIKYRNIRFDVILLSMIEEVAQRIEIDSERFLLHGFSGGGQFAHRFFYLHPDRLRAVSIGAPGRITLIDPDKTWWLGWSGMAEAIGSAPSVEPLLTVPVHMVVGSDDVETWEIDNPGDSNWMPGIEATGGTRIERLHSLRRNFEDHGISVRFDLVPGVAHEPLKVLDAVKSFFLTVL